MKILGFVDSLVANTAYTEIYDAKISKQPVPELYFKYAHDMDLNKYTKALEYKNIIVKKVLEIVNENIDIISDEVLDRIIKLMMDVEIYKRSVKIKGVNGEYYVKENAIVLNNKKSIYHECLHLASSYYDSINNIEYSGFRKTEYNKIPFKLNDVGIGINEGFTQYQALKIYGDSTPKVYTYETEIAERISKIIGQDTMKKLYFEHDYLGLVKELNSHFKYKDVTNILLCLDYIMYCNNSFYPNFKKQELIDNKKRIIELTMNKYHS